MNCRDGGSSGCWERQPYRSWSLRLVMLAYGLAGVTLASRASAQLVSPPETVWGDIDQQPEGFQFGGIELLAGLLIALTATLGICAFLAFRHRALHSRGAAFPELQRLRRQLAWCAFGATPLLGLATIVLGGPHLLFGMDVALLGVALSLPTVLIATAALVTR